MDGTITNTICIVVGSLAGAWLHSGIKEKYKRVLYDALGLASLAIGLNAAITHFPQSKYPVLFIVSLALGGVVGTWLDIDGRFQRLVNKHSKGGGREASGRRLKYGNSPVLYWSAVHAWACYQCAEGRQYLSIYEFHAGSCFLLCLWFYLRHRHGAGCPGIILLAGDVLFYCASQQSGHQRRFDGRIACHWRSDDIWIRIGASGH